MLLMLCWCRETNYGWRAPWKPINGHQGREAGGAIHGQPNTPPRQQDTAWQPEHLEKTFTELIQNIFTSGWPQFVIKRDVN